MVASHTYDKADRLTSLTNAKGGTTVSSYTYTYDANGNRESQVEKNGGTTETTTYTYDDLDRLATITYPVDATYTNGRVVEYGYDGVGNRTREMEKDATLVLLADKQGVFDNVNRLTTLTDLVTPANSTTFTWDKNGNQTSKTVGAGTPTDYRYDTRDKLVETAVGLSILGRFQYCYDGKRIKKIGEDGIRQYVYDQTSLLAEYDNTGIQKAKYDYGSDRLISLTRADEGRRYFQLDGLRSVVNLTSDSGSTVASYHLDPWGNFRFPTELDSSKNRFAFTGHIWDEETGLYHAKARYFDPKLGRFLTQDSFLGQIDNPPSLHRYLYASANPTTYVDPTGHFTQLVQAWQSVDQLNKLADVVEKQAATSNPAGGNSGTWWGQALNFAEHYKSKVGVALMRLPGQVRETGLNVLTPGGAEGVRTGRPEPNRGPYADLQAEALRGAADPENSIGLRASFATTAVISQPAVALEQGVLKPIERGVGHSEKIAVHTIQAHDSLRSGDVVGAAIQAAEAGNETLQAFNALASPILLGEGIRVTSANIGPLGAPRSETALTPYNPEFAAQQLLGRPPTTPGGRQIYVHAAGRMTNPPAGRATMTVEEVDLVLDTATKVRKITPHKEGITVTVQRPDLPGKPQVVVDSETGKRVLNVIKQDK